MVRLLQYRSELHDDFYSNSVRYFSHIMVLTATLGTALTTSACNRMTLTLKYNESSVSQYF